MLPFSLGTEVNDAQSDTSANEDGAIPTPSATGALAAVKATIPPPIPTPYTPPVMLLDGRASYVFRSLFATPGSSLDPVVSVDVREAMVVLELSDGVALDLNEEEIPWLVRFSSRAALTLVVRIAGRETFLNFSAVEPTLFSLPASGLIGVRSNGATYPRFIFWASSTHNGTSETLHVEVSLTGDLYIAVEPIDDDIIIWRPTGEALDLSSTMWESDALVGLGLRTANNCETTPGSCQTLLFNEVLTGTVDRFPAPMDGTLTCRSDGAFQLAGSTVRLLLTSIDQ